MAIRSYIPIEKESIPEVFEIDLAGSTYLFGINYAESEDIYSVDLYESGGTPIVLGERLVLNSRLWVDIIDDRLPSLDIVPLDESGQEKAVTSDNFMITVFLYIDDLAPDASTPSLENEVSSI